MRRWRRGDCGSAQDRLDHVSINVRQPEISAGIAIDEPRVVDPHQVQDRGVIVMHVHRVLDDVDAEFVGLTVRAAALDSAAGEQGRERLGVVVAALGSGGIGPRRPAELGADGDQRRIEKPRAFRSLISAAIAWSTRRALGRCSCMLPWASQLLFEPESISSTTRTPRSISRRATRH